MCVVGEELLFLTSTLSGNNDNDDIKRIRKKNDVDDEEILNERNHD